MSVHCYFIKILTFSPSPFFLRFFYNRINCFPQFHSLFDFSNINPLNNGQPTDFYYFRQLLLSLDGGQAAREKHHLVVHKKNDSDSSEEKTKAYPALFSISEVPNTGSFLPLSHRYFQILLTSFLILFIAWQ